jgi:hypothetical protein
MNRAAFCRRFVWTNRLSRALLSASLSSVWKVYADDDPSNPAKPNENATGPATHRTRSRSRRAGCRRGEVRGHPTCRLSGTYDFAWTSHSASYGFSIGSTADWHPDRAELAKQIRSFLADIYPKTATYASDPDAGPLLKD